MGEQIIAAVERGILAMRAFRTLPKEQRYAALVILRKRGYTLLEVGMATGYSRERVRMLIKEHDKASGS